MAEARDWPLDALRGAIMIVMALDHANDFIAGQHPAPEMWTGVPRYVDAVPFVTRLVTHLAAPGFFFLMGVSLWLLAVSRRRTGWTTRQITLHLMARGAILIVLQFFVENRAWPIGQTGGFPIYFGVLFGLGAAMIFGSLLLNVRSSLLLGISAALILITEVVVGSASARVAYSVVVRALIIPGTTGSVLVYYPVVPWLGVTGLGIAFGRWLKRDRAAAYRGAGLIGVIALVLFVVLRALGDFGNIRSALTANWIDVLNVVKYPPAIVFLLLTLGIDLLLLRAFSRAGQVAPRWLKPIIVLGQSPLFFYLVHLYLYAILGLIVGHDLGILRMLPFWLFGLLILLPLCWLYGQFKQRQPMTSVWRLL
ncbi:MAG: heparan-alpha-glucosaminide N-acetyltransferase domain-containing protein [Anaerolineae bacterium]